MNYTSGQWPQLSEFSKKRVYISEFSEWATQLVVLKRNLKKHKLLLCFIIVVSNFPHIKPFNTALYMSQSVWHFVIFCRQTDLHTVIFKAYFLGLTRHTNNDYTFKNTLELINQTTLFNFAYKCITPSFDGTTTRIRDNTRINMI